MECGLCGHLRYSNYEAVDSNSVQTTHTTIIYAFTLLVNSVQQPVLEGGIKMAADLHSSIQAP